MVLKLNQCSDDHQRVQMRFSEAGYQSITQMFSGKHKEMMTFRLGLTEDYVGNIMYFVNIYIMVQI